MWELESHPSEEGTYESLLPGSDRILRTITIEPLLRCLLVCFLDKKDLGRITHCEFRNSYKKMYLTLRRPKVLQKEASFKDSYISRPGLKAKSGHFL